jgi:hypothetical protein
VEASAETPFYAIFGVCATIREMLGALFFFFYRKLVGGTVAQRVFLAY